jgi:SAM-dependent methyltransferase
MRTRPDETVLSGPGVFSCAMTSIAQEVVTTAAPDLAGAAYGAFAPYYDRFTFDHDYERWTRTLEPLARRHGLAGKRLLDVACGTGKSFEPFLRRGYDVTACDLSAEMARRAAERGGGAVDVHVSDMRALGVLGEFDLAICLGDSMNYLHDPADLAAAFAAIRANLAPGGVLLFDVNTLFTYRRTFLVDRCLDDGELFFAWRGARAEPVRPGTLAEATIEIFAPATGPLWARETSRHVQRHHPEGLLRAALAQAGFEDVAAYGQDGTGAVQGPPDEDALTKTIFAARAAGGASRPTRR